MSELEKLLNVSDYIAHAVCGIYFFFGVFALLVISCVVDYLSDYIEKKKKKRNEKEEKND